MRTSYVRMYPGNPRESMSLVSAMQAFIDAVNSLKEFEFTYMRDYGHGVPKMMQNAHLQAAFENGNTITPADLGNSYDITKLLEKVSDYSGSIKFDFPAIEKIPVRGPHDDWTEFYAVPTDHPLFSPYSTVLHTTMEINSGIEFDKWNDRYVCYPPQGDEISYLAIISLFEAGFRHDEERIAEIDKEFEHNNADGLFDKLSQIINQAQLKRAIRKNHHERFQDFGIYLKLIMHGENLPFFDEKADSSEPVDAVVKQLVVNARID